MGGRGARVLTVLTLAATVFGPAAPPALAALPTQCVYVANHFTNNVSAVQVKLTGNNKRLRDMTPELVATIPVGRRPWGIVGDPVNGEFVFVTNSKDNTVSRIDTATNTVTHTIRVGKQPRAITVHPDGSRVYVANFKGNSISVIDTTSNEVVDTVKLAAKRPIDVEIDPTGTNLVVLSKKKSLLEVLDASGARLARSLAPKIPFSDCDDIAVQAFPQFPGIFFVAGGCGQQLCRWTAPNGTTVCSDSPLGTSDLVAGRADCVGGCETVVARQETGTVVFEDAAGGTVEVEPEEPVQPCGLSVASTSATIAPGRNWTIGAVVGHSGSSATRLRNTPADLPSRLFLFGIDTRKQGQPKIAVQKELPLKDARGATGVHDFTV